ncbi:MAG: hypothetical protein M1814_004901 [Vezdaea aestivalis]|nr:MAG: hypothetical protein M1814_004901 [Vezdaea aestivalis]
MAGTIHQPPQDTLPTPFPAQSTVANGPINGVPTDITAISFSNKLVVTISQGGRLAQWVHVPLKSADPNRHDQYLPTASDDDSLLPMMHLTPTTLLGGASSEREIMGHLIATQIASAIARDNQESCKRCEALERLVTYQDVQRVTVVFPTPKTFSPVHRCAESLDDAMDLDPLSPVAPARVKVLLLPIGKIKKTRFNSFVRRITPHNVIRLVDISPDGRPNRTMFSPLAFPSGAILINFTTASSPSAVNQTSPFEPFREPLVVLGISDSYELRTKAGEEGDDGRLTGSYSSMGTSQLEAALEDARAQFPKALAYQILLFDYQLSAHNDSLGDKFVVIPPESASTSTSTKTVVCDVMSLLLAELNTYAKYLQGLDTIDSPRVNPGFELNGMTRGISGIDRDASKRYSQMPHVTRPPRPNSSAEDSRTSHRMSMPIQLPSSNSDFAIRTLKGHDPPPTGGSETRTPPTTFGEIAEGSKGIHEAVRKVQENGHASMSDMREHSRDRVSVSGFGSGSVRERDRNKGKGRIGVVIGALYLLAGRWTDALRELGESASIAKENLDHLWHAKGLESILVCMLMLSWSGIEYQIPAICYSNRTSSHSQSISTTPGNDTAEQVSGPQQSTQALRELLPDLINTTLHVYVRTLNRPDQPLPRLPYLECIVRFAKTLAVLHARDGLLDDVALDWMIFDKAPPTSSLQPSSMRLGLQPSRAEVTSMVLRAYPSASDGLSNAEHICILAGIAAVFSIIGYHRKKATILRNMVLAIIPSLEYARKAGAAEMGVHPAAGLAALKPGTLENSFFAKSSILGESSDSGIGDVLLSLGRLYGIVSHEDNEKPMAESKDTTLTRYSDSEITSRILKDAKLDSFGNQSIKSSVLKTSISLCEFLPDFQGVLHFTTSLLRTDGAGIRPVLNNEDQLRLATVVTRTVNVANRLGISNVEAEYWDEFLVVGVEVVPSSLTSRLLPHVQSDLKSTPSDAQSGQGAFFYNPFLKKLAVVSKPQLVVGEQSEFLVTLQNPYEFDLVLDQFKLETEGVTFESIATPTIISPRSSQLLPVYGIPRENGGLTVTGGTVTVRGCRPRRFPILSSAWRPKPDLKNKRTGLDYLQQIRGRPISAISTKFQIDPFLNGLSTSQVSCNVVKAQPTMVIEYTSLNQSALMVLKGESRVFSVTVRNVSDSIAVDFVVFSFKDSTDGPLQAAMNSRDVTSIDLYELELMYGHRPAFKWLHPDPKNIRINPGGEKTFDIQIFGKPGLEGGLIQIDYGFVDALNVDRKEEFYTRQLQLPVNVTVNTNIEVIRADCAAFSGLGLTPALPQSSQTEQGSSSVSSLDKDSSFVLILDLRNDWVQPLSIEIGSSDLEPSGTQKVHDIIQPGYTTRLMIPMPLIHLSDPFAPIPSLNPSRRPATGHTGILSDAELTTRESFWYREALLKRLVGTWKADELGRTGQIEMRNIRLSPRLVDAIRLEDVDIHTELIAAASDVKSRVGLEKTRNNGMIEVPVEEFILLKTRITNRTKGPLSLVVRLQPSLRNQSHAIALDMSRRMAWSGLTQQSVLAVAPGAEAVVEAGVCVLCRGEYEIGAMAEEIKGLGAGEKGNEGGKKSTERRRIWYARRSCIFVARERAK